MGIDLLEFGFRIEKRFGIKINKIDFRTLEPIATSRRPPDMTAGEMHDWVVKLCEARGVTFPYSSWTRVRLELAKVVRRSPHTIHRETLVIRDLGFS